MTKIIIDNAIPYVKGVLEPFCEIVYMEGREISAGDVADADALMVRTRTRCDSNLLAGSKVRAIATATVGYDHIDTRWCREAGIEVFTAAGCNARGVLQWLAAVLALDSETYGWEPTGMTLGVVGTGNVGSLSAIYGKTWGFDILCCDPPRERAGLPSPVEGGYVSLEEISRRSDIVTFHTPLTYSGEHPTFHMAGRDFFSAMGAGTLVINASRGEVVDTGELKEAVGKGICRAALDTWEHEPGIDFELLSRAVIATPHIAGYTAQGKANATAISVAALARFFGFPLAGWYPSEVRQTVPRDIGWQEMKNTIRGYYDIRLDDEALRAHPSNFEQLRTEYIYRQEYF